MTQPMCDWAGCDKPAVKHEAGWNHCRTHLAHHREQTGKKPHLTREQRDHLIHDLWREHADEEIAIHVGMSVTGVRAARSRLGLVRKPGPRRFDISHGTLGGERAERRRGLTPCGRCAVAKAEYDAQRHQERIARRQQKDTA